MNVDRTPAHIGIDKSTKICYDVIMLDPEGNNTSHNPRKVRRAGLIQRIGNSLEFDVEGSDNPNLDYGYSRTEKVVLGVAAVSMAAATLLGINNALNREQAYHDRIAAEHDTPDHVDSDPNSRQYPL